MEIGKQAEIARDELRLQCVHETSEKLSAAGELLFARVFSHNPRSALSENIGTCFATHSRRLAFHSAREMLCDQVCFALVAVVAEFFSHFACSLLWCDRGFTICFVRFRCDVSKECQC
ncbi:hypothetical protein TRVL_01822 [Trypanosoma vivax]|nr:hypothetical protein TRVL_01822 [Trypanosoma vivax]